MPIHSDAHATVILGQCIKLALLRDAHRRGLLTELQLTALLQENQPPEGWSGKSILRGGVP